MKFFYVRDDRKRPVACFAYREVKSEGSGGLQFGLSVWNPKDELSKKEGRLRAIQRLESHSPGWVGLEHPDEDPTFRLLKFLWEADGTFEPGGPPRPKRWLRRLAEFAEDQMLMHPAWDDYAWEEWEEEFEKQYS